MVSKRKIFMSKLTVRDFARSVGLKEDGSDYIAATIFLKFLCRKGIAKEAYRINSSAIGRKSVVFEVPETFTISLAQSAPAPVLVVAEAQKESFSYDYGDEEEAA